MNIEHPSRIWLPRTGQTTSYADGDDGYFQAGNPRATRFVNNGNGTVSDRATGLQWVKQPELIIPGASVSALNQALVAHGSWETSHPYIVGDLVADADGSQSTQYTISAISKATLGIATTTAPHGLSSGQTILIAGCTDGTFAACNGTRTVTVTDATHFTFDVNTSGFTTYGANSGKVNQVKYYVCSAIHTSGTFATDIAADRFRQTVWTASAADLVTPATMPWANALANCLGTKWNPTTGLSYAGFTDWRLPSIFEIVSLVDVNFATGALINALFPNTQAGAGDTGVYWSSSTWKALATYYAYTGGFRAPNNLYCWLGQLKTVAVYVRPVRGGRINANW